MCDYGAARTSYLAASVFCAGLFSPSVPLQAAVFAGLVIISVESWLLVLVLDTIEMMIRGRLPRTAL